MAIQLTEECLIENSAINWFRGNGYTYIYGSELSPDSKERDSYRDVILKNRFIQAIKRINPWLNNNLAEKAYRAVLDLDHPDFLMKGKLFYEMLTFGVKVTFREDGKEKTRLVRLIDFENPENNEFLIANQFTVEYQYSRDEYRRPDLVLFINGIPIAVFEFKSFNADETAKDAFSDHKIKMRDIPQLYIYTQIVVTSDGLETKYGSPTSDWERFFVWEGIKSDNDLDITEIEEGFDTQYKHYRYFCRETKEEMTSLEVLIKGLFSKENILEYIQDFVIYEKSGDSYIKKIAMYHQFYAVRKAVKKTVECILKSNSPEERRIGVIWHTQGSGKSLTMLLYARKTLKIRELENPLLVFVTDRRELDEQLYKVFADTMGEVVKQAESIEDLQESLKTITGGIIFTTIQKFGKRGEEEYPFLTNRRNIVVIADEAHRSQYRELAMNLRKAIPNASFMGFTATPIELEDRDTYLVFGDPISIYSMDKARRHNVVVPIYYEARLVSEHLTNEFIDEEFEEISEEVVQDSEMKESLKRKFATLERLILTEDRLDKVAKDIVEHFNKRTQELIGKSMVVVISRRAAIELYKRIKSLPNAPSVEVVISGNKTKDPEDFWPYLRSKSEYEELARNFKNPDSDTKMVIVVDMWLTGFDVPCLHTMYFDKPMKNHSLVQAIARVNRVFKDKPGGLIIDYIGIADNLRKSLSVYTLETIKEVLTDINEVLNLLKEKYDIVRSFLYGVNYENWTKLSGEELSRLTVSAYDKICKDEETKKSFIKNFLALKKLYALASPHPETIKIKDEIRFFEMIKKMIVKYATSKSKDITRVLEYEINQLISRSISAEEPVDVLSLINKDKIDISIFDDEFLKEFKDMEYKNYAAELLSKILRDALVAKMKINPYRYRSFYEILKDLIEKYNMRIIDTVDIIEKLIEIGKEIRKAEEDGKRINLSEEELSFYDLLLSKEKFFENRKQIEEAAKEIVKIIGPLVKVTDWNKKRLIQAKIKSALKMALVDLVHNQANYNEIETLSKELLDHIEKIYAAA